jgi:hypothetical protein
MAEVTVHGVPGVVIAIASGKYNYTEFHDAVTVSLRRNAGRHFCFGGSSFYCSRGMARTNSPSFGWPWQNENQAMTDEEQLAGISALLETLAVTTVAHDNRIEKLVRITDENSAQIAELSQAIANVEKQWQAYIKPLRRQ